MTKKLSKSDFEKTLAAIITAKYKSVFGGATIGKFAVAKFFEGNAIGQIGEEFAKEIIDKYAPIVKTGVIHTGHDVETISAKKFEVKTARMGKNKTFQFNGIDPRHRDDYNFLLCIGICDDDVVYRIFKSGSIKYKHEPHRKHYIIESGFEKQLVKMNPNNEVNFKLTLNLKDLFDIALLDTELLSIVP